MMAKTELNILIACCVASFLAMGERPSRSDMRCWDTCPQCNRNQDRDRIAPRSIVRSHHRSIRSTNQSLDINEQNYPSFTKRRKHLRPGSFAYVVLERTYYIIRRSRRSGTECASPPVITKESRCLEDADDVLDQRRLCNERSIRSSRIRDAEGKVDHLPLFVLD